MDHAIGVIARSSGVTSRTLRHYFCRIRPHGNREEVERRWGTDDYQRADQWYRSLTDDQRTDFASEHAAIAT